MYGADILDLYYADDEEKTIELLNKKSILYPDQQLSTVIDDLCSKTLISTKCMQTYMDKIWYGDQFHVEKNFIWEILVKKNKKFKKMNFYFRSVLYVFVLYYYLFHLYIIEFFNRIKLNKKIMFENE